MESLRHDEKLRERVERNLEGFERRTLDRDDLIPAAVACVLVGDARSETAFVLTRRTPRLRSHGGQWALPGGRIEEKETAVAAALRELEEEVGLTLDDRDVLGFLDDFRTRSGYRITPVVLWGPGSVELRPDPEEVAAAYLVSLRSLDDPGIPRILPNPDASRPLLTIPLERPSTVVYAPTAALVYQLREVAIHGRPTRVDGYGEPRFAWS